MKNAAPPPPFIVDDDLDFRGFLLHLRRGWKLVAALTALGMLAGLLITSRRTPVYLVLGIVRIPWTWDVAAREPATVVTAALKIESNTKRRGIVVTRLSINDAEGRPLGEPSPIQLSARCADIEQGKRRLTEFLADVNGAPDIMKLAEEARTIARQESARLDLELAKGEAADRALLIERRERLQAALDRDFGLGWDLQPWSDGRNIHRGKTAVVLLGLFFGFLLGALGALARWPRFMMS